MRPDQERLYRQGYVDRFNQLPGEFTSGRTYTTLEQNEWYDYGVNCAERDFPRYQAAGADGKGATP